MQPYIAQLRAKYPSADGPSLVAAFLVLHELTAVVPLFAGFWACRLLGVGASLVGWAIAESETGEEPSWAQRKVKTWVGQGENQAERLGRRYGVFGFEKETREERQSRRAANDDTQDVAMSVGTHSIGGDVANLVAAYLAVKVRSRFVRFSPSLTR